MNRNAKIIGLDIAKNVFAMCGIDEHGVVVMKRLLSRGEMLETFAKIPPTSVAIEACAGSHYWGRELTKLQHEVRLIAGQHPRRYVSGNKNDMKDAQGVAEARSRAKMKYVPINTEAQQDLQMLHRSRQALMVERTGMINRIRAFAAEYGKVFPLGGGEVSERDSRLARRPGERLVGLGAGDVPGVARAAGRQGCAHRGL